MRPHPLLLTSLVFVGAGMLAAPAFEAAGQIQSRRRVVRPPQGPPQRLTGIDALRALHKSGKPQDAERMAYSLLWKDVRQPEVLFLLAQTEERLRKSEEAAAYYTLFLRTLDEPGAAAPAPPADVAKQRPFAERRLKALRQDEQALAAAYAKAAGRKFESPDKVGDAWMNNVKGSLFSLHGLYAWKLVGGRKDSEADWIHNTQGAMHRSGMKRVDEVEGRKGVLFTVPLKDINSQDADQHNREALQKLGHNSRVEAVNRTGGKVVRAGVRAYGFPVLVKIKAGDKELLSETVGTDKWYDLKADLPAAEGGAAKDGQRVVMELIVPEGQKWSEGVWIDYFDFFVD